MQDFLDADSGVPLSEAGQQILGYSHTRVRAYLAPKEVGHFAMKLAVANLMDARNCELLRVHVMVSSTVQEEGLRLMTDGSDGTIDFGNCYSWVPTRSLLTVRSKCCCCHARVLLLLLRAPGLLLSSANLLPHPLALASHFT